MKFPIPFFISTFALVFGFVLPELKGAEISSKQSEALFQELVRYPQFKTADEEMSAAYKKARSGMSEKGQTALRDEQRKWLKDREQAIASAQSKDRVGVAVRLTRERSAKLTEGPAIDSSELRNQTPPVQQAIGGPGGISDPIRVPVLSESQSEQLYRELLKSPGFVAADRELNRMYVQQKNRLQGEQAKALQRDQQAWLKNLYVVVYGSLPGERASIATQRTQERCRAISTGSWANRGKTELPSAGERMAEDLAAQGAARELFQLLLKDPKLKSANDAVSQATQRVWSSLSPAAQSAKRQEQREWLDFRDRVIFSADEDERPAVALELTKERVRVLEGDQRGGVMKYELPKVFDLGRTLTSCGLDPSRAVRGIMAASEIDEYNLSLDRVCEFYEELVFRSGAKQESVVREFQDLSVRLSDTNCFNRPLKEISSKMSLGYERIEVINGCVNGWLDPLLLEKRTSLIKQRIAELEKKLLKSQKREMPPEILNSSGNLEKLSGYLRDKLTSTPRVVYQGVKWDDRGREYFNDFLGPRYRLVGIGSKQHVFDKFSRLLLGSIDLRSDSNGPYAFGNQGDDALCGHPSFFGNGDFAYVRSFSYKYLHGKLYHLPSLLELLSTDARSNYSQEGPLMGPVRDRSGNFGFYRGDGWEPSEANKKLEFVPYSLFRETESEVVVSKYLKSYPGAPILGIFQDCESGAESSFRPRFASDTLTGPALQTGGVVMAAESIVERVRFSLSEFKCRQTLKSKAFGDGVLAVEVPSSPALDRLIIHKVKGGHLSSVHIELSSLFASSTAWRGPQVCANRCSIDAVQYDSTAGGMQLVDLGGGHGSLVRRGQDSRIHLPPGTTLDESITDYDGCAGKSAYEYPLGVGQGSLLVCNWNAMFGKNDGSQYISLYSTRLRRWVFHAQLARPGRDERLMQPGHFFDPQNNALWISIPRGSEVFAADSAYLFRKLNEKSEYSPGEAVPASALVRVDLNSNTIAEKIEGLPAFECFAVSGEWIFGLPRYEENTGEIFSRRSREKIGTVVWNDAGDVSIVNPKGYYASRGDALKDLAVAYKGSVYPFEQFDLRLNRPDMVYASLGYPAGVTDLMKKSCVKRLEKMRITEEMLRPDFHVPTVDFEAKIPQEVADNEISLPVAAGDTLYPLSRLKVLLNGVPVNGLDGELVPSEKSIKRSIKLTLASGRNKLQVSVVNSVGAESLARTVEVSCLAKRPDPVLHVVALGVSKYAHKDGGMNLRYASKDADDVAAKLRSGAPSVYGGFRELVLKDAEVTRESLPRIRKFLSEAKIDDSVVLFLAGHGILDDRYDYYFGTSDIDPLNPRGRGIPFQEIEDLLGGVRSLKKLMLLDTCHAGELDDSERADLLATNSKTLNTVGAADLGQRVAVRSVGVRGLKSKPVVGAKGMTEWHDRIQNMLIDLRRGGGTTVISSSAGAEYAFESSEQANGLFTYALLEGLSGAGPATPNGSVVKVSQLVDYVKTRVGQLTQNKQTPNVRRINLEEDFPLVAPLFR
jgi:uncharacterized protein YecT (DUF1311 family)